MARDMASLAVGHAHRVLTTASVAIDQVAALVRDAPSLNAVHSIDHWKRLREHTAHLEGGESLWVVDANGKTILESASYPGRQAPIRDFASHLSSDRPLSIGPVTAERGEDGRVVYTLIRPLRDESGRAVAAVLAVMNAAYLTRFPSPPSADDSPVIGVYRHTGELVARRPTLPDPVGKPHSDAPLLPLQLHETSEGMFAVPPMAGGVTRITALQRVGDQGVQVLVSLDPERALAEWRARSLRTLGEHLIGALAVLLGMAWAFRFLGHGRLSGGPAAADTGITNAPPAHQLIDSQGGIPPTPAMGESRQNATEASHDADTGNSDQDPSPVSTVMPSTPVGTRRALTILLAEDDPTIRRSVAALLRDWNHRVIEAAHADEALAALQGPDTLDLLFSAVVMPPGTTGTELAAQARRLRPELPILLAFGSPPHAVGAEMAGIAGVATITKPYDIGALKAQIARLCGTDPP